jgi:hypothetical protein
MDPRSHRAGPYRGGCDAVRHRCVQLTEHHRRRRSRVVRGASHGWSRSPRLSGESAGPWNAHPTDRPGVRSGTRRRGAHRPARVVPLLLRSTRARDRATGVLMDRDRHRHARPRRVADGAVEHPVHDLHQEPRVPPARATDQRRQRRRHDPRLVPRVPSPCPWRSRPSSSPRDRRPVLVRSFTERCSSPSLPAW